MNIYNQDLNSLMQTVNKINKSNYNSAEMISLLKNGITELYRPIKENNVFLENNRDFSCSLTICLSNNNVLYESLNIYVKLNDRFTSLIKKLHIDNSDTCLLKKLNKHNNEILSYSINLFNIVDRDTSTPTGAYLTISLLFPEDDISNKDFISFLDELEYSECELPYVNPSSAKKLPFFEREVDLTKMKEKSYFTTDGE